MILQYEQLHPVRPVVSLSRSIIQQSFSRTYLETPPSETYRRTAVSGDKAGKRLLFLSHVKRMLLAGLH